MTLATLIVLAAAEEGEHSANVALDTILFPIIALAVFAALALVTASYRNVSNRHAHKAEVWAQTHANDMQQTGHGH